jgi:hypothetical protein
MNFLNEYISVLLYKIQCFVVMLFVSLPLTLGIRFFLHKADEPTMYDTFFFTENKKILLNDINFLCKNKLI